MGFNYRFAHISFDFTCSCQYVMFIHGPAFVMLLPGLMGGGAVFPAPTTMLVVFAVNVLRTIKFGA